MDSTTCKRCFKIFSSQKMLERHLNKKIPCKNVLSAINKKKKSKKPNKNIKNNNDSLEIEKPTNISNKIIEEVNNTCNNTKSNEQNKVKLENESKNRIVKNKKPQVPNRQKKKNTIPSSFKNDSIFEGMDDDEIEHNLQVLLDFLTNEKENIKEEINRFRTSEEQTDEELLEYVIDSVNEEHDLYQRIIQYQMTDMYYKKILVEYKVGKITSQVEEILTKSLDTCCDKFFPEKENNTNESSETNKQSEIELTEEEKNERKKVIKKIETMFDKKFDAFLNKCKMDVFKQIQDSVDEMVSSM